MKPIDKKIVIGIAGGIGTGKSTILDYLKKEKKAYIIKADDLGHEVLKKGEKGYKEAIKHFGHELLNEEENIDNNKLARIIFENPNEKKWLENLVHPLVLEKIKKEIQKEDKLIVLETAIMFETKCNELCDYVLGILTDRNIRIERLISTRGYSREKCIKIMDNQMSDEDLKKRCDYILYNNENKDVFMREINDFFFAL